MEKERLAAFTDGVVAVIITIMVLELKPPHGESWAALFAEWRVFVSYIVSFVYVGLYWNNHHHLFHLNERIDGRVMWANLFFLFWLSLFPFVTSWVADTRFEGEVPNVAYGIVLFMAAVSWIPLQRALIACNGGKSSELAQAIGRDVKGKLSVLLYATGIAVAFFSPQISCVVYATVAAMWFIPDPRIESKVVDS